jgi:hypothetical protein
MRQAAIEPGHIAHRLQNRQTTCHAIRGQLIARHPTHVMQTAILNTQPNRRAALD